MGSKGQDIFWNREELSRMMECKSLHEAAMPGLSDVGHVYLWRDAAFQQAAKSSSWPLEVISGQRRTQPVGLPWARCAGLRLCGEMRVPQAPLLLPGADPEVQGGTPVRPGPSGLMKLGTFPNLSDEGFCRLGEYKGKLEPRFGRNGDCGFWFQVEMLIYLVLLPIPRV